MKLDRQRRVAYGSARMPEGNSGWRRRLEPDAVWRAIDWARASSPEAVQERRRLRSAMRYLRDQLDAFFYAHLLAGGHVGQWSARQLANQLVDLLLELEAIDLSGIADLLDNPRRRASLRRRSLHVVVRPDESATKK